MMVGWLWGVETLRRCWCGRTDVGEEEDERGNVQGLLLGGTVSVVMEARGRLAGHRAFGLVDSVERYGALDVVYRGLERALEHEEDD